MACRQAARERRHVRGLLVGSASADAFYGIGRDASAEADPTQLQARAGTSTPHVQGASIRAEGESVRRNLHPLRLDISSGLERPGRVVLRVNVRVRVTRRLQGSPALGP